MGSHRKERGERIEKTMNMASDLNPSEQDSPAPAHNPVCPYLRAASTSCFLCCSAKMAKRRGTTLLLFLVTE